MSTTLFGSALPRRLASIPIAALFGLTLTMNPMSAPTADAAVPAIVGMRALHVAASEVGVSYRYGGTSPRSGFDCAGLTQYSYARVGMRLARTTQQADHAPDPIQSVAPRPGDLVFFYSGNSIYHVGVYAGNGYMYAAPHTGARVMKERIWSSQVYFGRVR